MYKISSVGYECDVLFDKAQQLARQLDFVLDKEADSCLFFTVDKLTLKIPGFSLLWADFTASTWNKRKNEGKKQGIVRACKPASGVKILDATAGWGRDAAVLASFGAEVIMLERNLVMASLLSDALLHRDVRDKELLNLSLQAMDARSYLNALSQEEYPDIIYIDPMHPERNKSALVKKDLQVLQQMIGPDEDAIELIRFAISHAKQRVVVKWPQKKAPLLPADSCIEGKTVRFDVYLP